MRAYEFLIEAANPKVGRALQHAEDLVIVDGSKGALEALDKLESIATSVDDITIKWDGCIHPDSLIQTDLGVMRIEEAINTVNNGKALAVLQHDFGTQNDVYAMITNAVKKEGSKRWVEIELENSEMLRLTEDHEVYTTNRGWVEAKDLTENDDIKEITK